MFCLFWEYIVYGVTQGFSKVFRKNKYIKILDLSAGVQTKNSAS